MTFLHKRVGNGSGTFGSDLRDLRELNNLSLEQVASATKISEAILRALEEDRLEDIEDPIFMERHLLTYVRLLGGYEPYFIARYHSKLDELRALRKTEELLPRARSLGRFDLIVGPHLIGFLGILILALGLGGYIWWQAQAVRKPPSLEIFSPADGERLEHSTVTVSGKTMSEAYVSVNGRDAPVDAQGSFQSTFDVRRGTTLITIVARRRRGSETRIERRVIYDRPLLETELINLQATSSNAIKK